MRSRQHRLVHSIEDEVNDGLWFLLHGCMGCLVHLVDLVCLVCLVEPD